MTRNKRRRITYISVGTSKIQHQYEILNKTLPKRAYKTYTNFNTFKNETETIKDKIICIGEYSENEEYFYITTIKPFSNNPNNQCVLKSKEKNWIINYCSILNNTNYCVALSQKPSNNKKNPIMSRISFAKYSTENFISEESINEELIFCCCNPKNTIELVMCGKNYLRLWNVFINEGALKEHQQRFLNSKQEKEQTFIKAQFFEKKPFLLIVGTLENMFYIIDSFQVIHEINACYSLDNIFDLNIQNLQNLEENEDIGNLKEEVENLTTKDLDEKLKEISILTNTFRKKKNMDNGSENNTITSVKSEKNSIENNEEENKVEEDNTKDDVFKRLYISKTEQENDAKISKNNNVKFFELINDNLLFIIYANDGCTLMYQIDWNRKMNDGDSEADFRKWKITDCTVIRLAKNIKTIHGFSMYKNTNDIILTVEAFSNKKRTTISLYKMKKILIIKKKKKNIHSLNYEYDLFNGFFENNQIKFFDISEKNKSIYYIDNNNTLNCFEIIESKYTIKHYFHQNIMSFSVNNNNNLLAISFIDKVCIFAKLKDEIKICAELEVDNSAVKWSSKGDILIIGGVNRKIPNNKSYCIFVIDAITFNTINVYENIITKINELIFLDNDRYLFCLLSNSYIMGLYLNIYSCSKTLHEFNEHDRGKSVVTNHFKLVFTHNSRGRTYNSFDYDSKLNLIIAVELETNKLYLIENNNLQKSEKKNNSQNTIEIYNTNLVCIKLFKELKILIGGDNSGVVKIFAWPLKGYEKNDIKNINDSLINYLNLDLGYVSSLLNYKNYTSFIILTNNTNLFINDVMINKERDEYKTIEYFSKPAKPQMELMQIPYELYEIGMDRMKKKQNSVKILEEAAEKIKLVMDEELESINNANNIEVENMENNLKQNTECEKIKLDSINYEITKMRNEMKQDTEKKISEMEKIKSQNKNKYSEKINLYNNEIARLKSELQDIKDSINKQHDSDAVEQNEYCEKLLNEYNLKYKSLQLDIQKSLLKLVNMSSEYDNAIYDMVNDYEKLLKNKSENIIKTKETNTKIKEEEKQKLEKALLLEEEHQAKLESKVKESDKLIEKNVEIKQSIINVTQRTITFQEQLLETEKNLVKIDKKLEDLVVKNKHLEQIRFVLEHRMTSLEKEKSPLEGQCAFLENQKNKLTEEFNKIILKINEDNQDLENKQSQLRTSLIQNYQIHDQKNYIEAKLTQLKNDLEQFLMKHRDTDEEKPLMEDKATYVALKFKKFYDKYFAIPIEDELLNYQYYSQKLQEQTDKDGIANNFDLIMRNKAEEKLICEKEKVEELIDVREKGFRRIQNENTILITECNRLRKNLHEIYMHVIDIEQRFENLTKINPKLNKNEIVNQIKQFIKITHEKIKANYAKNKKNKLNKKSKRGTSTNILKNNKNMILKTESNSNKGYTGNTSENKYLNSISNNNNKYIENNKNVNPYSNVIKLPDNKGKTAYGSNKFKNGFMNKFDRKGGLPMIEK